MFKKIPLLSKIKKNSSLQNQLSGNDSNAGKPADFLQQKELDKKLIYSLNKKKIPTLKQLKYLPGVLNPKQRLVVGGLVLLIIFSLITIITNFFYRNFKATPTNGGEYTIGLVGAPQYLNPLLAQTNDVDTDISRLIFSGLLKYNNELQLTADLAAKWEISEDQKTYTFILKDNLKWQDGQPLTADDVIFTFQSIKDPEFKSPLLVSFRGIEVEKVDDKTVVFVLPQPYPAFLDLLTTGLLPLHIWGEIPPVNANLTEYNLKPIGSGPWEFKSLVKDRLGNIKSYTLAANNNYVERRAYLDKITLKFYPDFETAVAALKNHSIDGVGFLPKDFKSQLNGQKNLNYYSLALPQYTAIFFNQKQNELLKEKEIRKALALSIDKTKILTDTLQLDGEIINGPILPFDIKINPDQIINFNLEAANKILDAAGWQRMASQDYQAFLDSEQQKTASSTPQNSQAAAAAEANQNPTTTQTVATTTAATSGLDSNQAFYRKKGDKILALTITTVNQSENTKAAKLIQDFWRQIGIKVDLEIIDSNKISREIIKPRSYEVLLFGIIVGSSSDPYPFWHSSQAQDPGLNLALFSNRNADLQLEEAKKTTDQEKQKVAYQKFQDIITAEIPAIFLYKPTYTYVADKKIKGINSNRITLPADRLNDSTKWYIKTNWHWQGKIR
ncbi:MAG: ABC transporter substrate-binding protein [Patescibacteria group bacterium]